MSTLLPSVLPAKIPSQTLTCPLELLLSLLWPCPAWCPTADICRARCYHGSKRCSSGAASCPDLPSLPSPSHLNERRLQFSACPCCSATSYCTSLVLDFLLNSAPTHGILLCSPCGLMLLACPWISWGYSFPCSDCLFGHILQFCFVLVLSKKS